MNEHNKRINNVYDECAYGFKSIYY